MFSTYDIYIEHFFSMAHLELISDVKGFKNAGLGTVRVRPHRYNPKKNVIASRVLKYVTSIYDEMLMKMPKSSVFCP